MSTVLTARLYFDEPRAAPSLIAGLVEAVEGWSPSFGGEGGEKIAMRGARWQGLRVVAAGARKPVFEEKEELDRASLVAAADPFAAPEQRLSTVVSFPAWRLHGKHAEKGRASAWVEAWGDDYGRAMGESPRHVWGSAAFTIANCTPFQARAAHGRPAAEPDVHVEENLQSFTDLLFGIIKGLSPRALKVYTDQAPYFPFNAHFAYYAGEEALLSDVRVIEAAWANGLPRHHVPPLRRLLNADAMAFHPWRPLDARRRLWQALNAGMGRAASITPAAVRDLLDTGDFDTFNLPGGFAVLEFPHFVNSFVDGFFTALLGRD